MATEATRAIRRFHPTAASRSCRSRRYDIEKNKGETDLWLVPTKSGKARQLTSAAASDSSPAWSPDGELIAFVSKRGDDKQPQIYVIAGRRRRSATRHQRAHRRVAPKWFPDSKRIAFMSQVWPDLKTWPEMEQRMKERDEPKMTAQRLGQGAVLATGITSSTTAQTHVYSISIDGGEPQGDHARLRASRWTSPNPIRHSYDISPDGAEIAFASDTDTSGIDPNFDIFVMPVDGGSATKHHGGQPRERRRTAVQPRRPPARLPQTDDQGLLRRSRAPDDLRASRRAPRAISPRTGIAPPMDSSGRRIRDSLFGAIDDAGTRRVYRFDVGGGAPKAITARAQLRLARSRRQRARSSSACARASASRRHW